ncbi:MAG: IS21 family transposase [Chloroflexi bacterium]|nr:IS21 family transposase [Chloroflexota bacterium]
MDIREILYRLQRGESQRAISRDLNINRKTVKRYQTWAEAEGLLEGDLPPLDALQQRLEATLPGGTPPQQVSSVEPYRDQVMAWREQQVEIAAIHQRLRETGYTGSYAAVWRFVRRLEPPPIDVTVRVESPPGEEAQVDFGYAGQMIDPKTGQLRKTWAFVMTLSWSRHQYVEFVFDQQVPTWLLCHRHAFAFFGGVPQRVVLDNLKTAILQAAQDDSDVQHAYRACAEHYGFLIAPCRVRTPQHKGKVEKGGVHYVKRNFLGGRTATDIHQANRDVRVWCETTAGARTHGTTRQVPLTRFTETEQALLQPLPDTPFDPGTWKRLKLHRDGYVVCEGSYYSAPFTHIGQTLRVRLGVRTVQLYTDDYQLIAQHSRATEAGERLTHPDHLPPEKRDGLRGREECRQLAADIGPATAAVVQTLLDEPVMDRLPTIQRLLRLETTYGADRLEAACQRALTFQDSAYGTIKRILQHQLDETPAPDPTPPVSRATTFVRGAVDLVGRALGAVTWML